MQLHAASSGPRRLPSLTDDTAQQMTKRGRQCVQLTQKTRGAPTEPMHFDKGGAVMIGSNLIADWVGPKSMRQKTRSGARYHQPQTCKLPSTLQIVTMPAAGTIDCVMDS